MIPPADIPPSPEADASKKWLKRLPSKLAVLATVAALCLAWLGWVLRTPGQRPLIVSMHAPALLSPDAYHHELGNIPTDSQVKDTFYLYNLGGKRLHIKKVDTSCGCTLVDWPRQPIAPGTMAPLHVTLDTSIKLGKVKKTIEVYSNDAQHAVKTLTITANVISTLKGHPKMTVKDPLVLFKGRCATCHVLRGVGKTGQALFIADCAMCHGQNAQGAVAMSLLGRDYRNPKQVALVRKMIAEGAPNNPEMPPFSKAHGGPLNDAEIDSLVTFLTYQHTRHLQGRLDTDDNTKGATPEDATTTTGHVP